MNERRTGLEKVNVSVEPAKDGRRPKLKRATFAQGQAAGVVAFDMCSKEKRVNMGSPPWREERSQPEIREEQAGLRRVAERSVVAMKRVMIVERRDLSSRAASLAGARGLFCVKEQRYDKPELPESRDFGGRGFLRSWLASKRLF